MTPPVYQRSRESAETFYWDCRNIATYKHFGTKLPQSILELLATSLFANHNKEFFEEVIHECRQFYAIFGPFN